VKESVSNDEFSQHEEGAILSRCQNAIEKCMSLGDASSEEMLKVRR